MSEVEPSIRQNEWFMSDGYKRIAIINLVVVGRRQRRLFRVLTWAEGEADRILVGYFPDLELAAEVTWGVYSFKMP